LKTNDKCNTSTYAPVHPLEVHWLLYIQQISQIWLSPSRAGVHPSDSVNCTVRLSYKRHTLANNLHWSNTLLVIASNEVRNSPKVYYVHTSILKMAAERTI